MKLRLALFSIVLVGSASVAAPAQAAPPDNDNLADATTISGPSGTAGADNTEATTEDGEPGVDADPSGIGHSVWYEWTAPQDGHFAFDTTASAAGDTVLTIYYTNGQPVSYANFVLLRQSDDLDNAGGDHKSGVILPATNGTTYYVQVSTWGYSPAATGPTTLTWAAVTGVDRSVQVQNALNPNNPERFVVTVENDGPVQAPQATLTVDATATPGAGLDPWQLQALDSRGACESVSLDPHGISTNCHTNALDAVAGPEGAAQFVVYGGQTDTGLYVIPVTLPDDAVSWNNTATYRDDYHAVMPLQLTEYTVEKAPGTQVWLTWQVDRLDGWGRTSRFTFKVPANARLEDDVVAEAWTGGESHSARTCTPANGSLVCDFSFSQHLLVKALVTPLSDAPMVTPYTLTAAYVSPLSATDSRVTAAQFCDNTPTAAGQVITGAPGANILCGGGGNDTIIGGRGNDLVFGGSGSDTISYAGSAAPMFVSLAQQSIDGWGSRPLDWHYGDGQDSFTGIESATGSSYADTLVGNGAVNRLTGGAGNDKLTGGGGKDVLNGGSGTDTCKETTDTRVSCEK